MQKCESLQKATPPVCFRCLCEKGGTLDEAVLMMGRHKLIQFRLSAQS